MGIRKAVEAGHWEEIERSYGGIIDYMIRKHPRPDGSKLSREEASALAKKMFDERRARESAADRERARLRGMLKWLESREDSASLMSRLADRARTLGEDGRMGKPATVRRFFRLMQSIRTELNRVGIPCCDGASMPRDAETLIYAYVKGGVGAYREALADIQKRSARKLNLGKPAGEVDAGTAKADEPPTACELLAKCCAQITDDADRLSCNEMMRLFAGERGTGPPRTPEQMNDKCARIHIMWRQSRHCR